jgi:putative phage-type endonuclease
MNNNQTKFYYHKDLKPFTPTRLQYLREQVQRLKGVKQPEQRTEAWYAMREERITASDFATALDVSPYQRDYTLLWKKVTRSRKFNTNSAILWGVKYEDVAIQVYEHRNKTKVREYGCIEHPNLPWLGASPDGITDDGVMVEIKCPSSRPITGKIPSYYRCQVQGQLEICELDRCDFLECKLEEYSAEEYYADNYEGNYFYSSLGMEKGAVVEFFKVESKSKFFAYVPIGLNREELEEWVRNEKSKYDNDDNVIYAGITYWKLTQVSCIPIYRNQEWFNEVTPKFQSFWNLVLRFREEGVDACKKYIDNVKAENRGKKRHVPHDHEVKTVKRKEKKKKASPKKKKKEEVMIDTNMNIFLGFEDKEPKKTKKKIIEEALKGSFVIMDGERIEIDDSELFGANGKEKNEKKLELNNGFMLNNGKFTFSNKEFKKEEEEKDEVFEFNKLEKHPIKKNKRNYKKKFSSWKSKKMNVPKFDLSEYEVFSNTQTDRKQSPKRNSNTGYKKKKFSGWKSKKMNVPKFDLSEYEVFSNH